MERIAFNLQKMKNVFYFYKSTLSINLSLSVFSVLFGGLENFGVVFLSVGFVSSLVFKEIYAKNDYLFYFNNGVSKTQLWFFSYLLNLLFVLIYKLLMQLF